MSQAFNLTAQVNLQAPANLKTVVAQIRREFGTVSADVKLNISSQSAKSIDNIRSRLDALNSTLIQARNNTTSLDTALRNLSGTLSSIQSSTVKVDSSFGKTASSVGQTAKSIKVATTEMEEFGKQSALAIRRFAAFSVVTSGVFALINAVNTGFKAFVEFDKELVKLQQVTGRGEIGLRSLEKEITKLSTSFGVSSKSLMEVASTLAQAGLSAEDTRVALAALAKTELAPSFDNLTDTTEGAIAAIRQFGLETKDLEKALGSINAVAAAFAVESKDIIAAIQRTGGVFAASSRGVSEGTEALNEFIAVFTSVRATTRESAETIATGLRTIFTRIQRAKTIDQLKEYGVELTDLEGKFVGPFEAVKRLSAALSQLDPRDLRFSSIVEELGGFRQIGKVIPLIQQFATAQEALKVAQRGQGSLTDAQVIAQKSLANQLAQVREQFLALVRDIGKSQSFQGLFKIVTGLASGLISLAGAFKPILPILAIMGAIKGVSAIRQFGSGFVGGLSRGGGAKGVGTNIGESLSGAKTKEKDDVKQKANALISENTTALKALTTTITQLISSVNNLGSSINNRGGTSTLNSGGIVRKFARGGLVPGVGESDSVPAMLQPGEFVIRKKAVKTLGAENLHRMNRYAYGGKVKDLSKYYKSIPSKKGYENLENQPIIDNSIFKEVKPTDLSSDQISEWRGSDIPRWKKFEYILSKKYKLGPPASPQFALLDFPKSRSEAKFMKKGDTYDDPDSIKGNNEATIAAKNFLYENSLLSGQKNIKPDQLITRAIADKPVTTYWADPDLFRKQGLNTGGLVQKFAFGGKALGARSKIKELDQSELSQLSTAQLIAYAKQQAYDIMTTGGSGMATGSEFIEVPSERIIPELESSLVSYMGKRGFWKEKIAPFARPKISSEKQSAKLDRQSALEAQVSKQADEVAAREQQWTKINKGSDIDNYLLSSLKDPILSDYKTVTSGGSLDKTFHNTRLRQAVNKALEEYDNFDYSPANIDKLVSGMAAERFAYGGLVQKFALGTEVKSVGSLSEDILQRLSDLGGPGPIKEAIGLDFINQTIRSQLPGRNITSKQLLSPKSLRSLTDSATLLPAIEPILQAAEKIKGDKESARKDQIARNLKASAGGAYQFGLASIYGPNGELGYSSVSAAQEIEGKDGQKYLTQIIRKSLPNRYLEAVQATKEDIAGLSQRAGERFQYTDIFGTGGPLAFDFDETLVKGADIFDSNGNIDIKAYNDINRVKETLQNAELTLLGKELKTRVSKYPEIMDYIRVLTARPPSNEPHIADTLSRLELPIPANKITGVTGGFNKVDNLSELETLIDDNLANIQSVLAGGKKGILYKESKPMDGNNPSSYRALSVTEGYALEEMVRGFGVNIGSDDDNDALKPIDFPKGLGVYASKWDMPPTIPTDTKRTNTSTAASVMWDRAKKFYVENFKLGGQVYGLQKDTGLKDSEFNELVRYGNTNDFTDQEFKNYLNQYLQRKAAKKDLMVNSEQLRQVLLGGTQTPQATSKQMDLASSLIGPPDAKYNPIYDKAIKRAYGGGVPKIPMSVIKELSKKLNVDIIQNDDNTYDIFDSVYGKTFYSSLNLKDLYSILSSKYGINPDMLELQKKALGGSIRKFANGGSAEDTVPALLTPGEFVINKKAAQKIGYNQLHKLNKADKLQGYNTGGIVGGIQRFFRGGVAEKDVARAQGSVISDVKEANKTFAMILGQVGKTIRASMVDGFKGVESIAAGGKTSLGTRFSETTRGQAAFRGQQTVMGLQIGGQKAAATTETVAHEAGHLADYSLGGKKGFASQTQGTFQFDLVEKVKPIMQKAFEKAGMSAEKISKYLSNNEELFAEFFAKASPQVRAIITSTTDAKEGMKALADHLGDDGYTYAGLEASDISSPASSSNKPGSSILGSVKTKASSAFSGLKDRIFGSGGGPSAPPNDPPNTPWPASMMKYTTEAKLAEKDKQQQENDDKFMEYRARKEGITTGAFRLNIARKLGKAAYEAKDNFAGRKEEMGYELAGRQDSFTALAASRASAVGNKDQEGLVAERINQEIEAIAKQMRALKPSIQNAEATAKEMAEAMMSGDLKTAQEKLIAALGDAPEDVEAMEIAMEQMSKELGISKEMLVRNFGKGKGGKDVERQQFVQSREGQRFGSLAEFAPDALAKFSGSRFGKGVGSAADFISGKGGKVSQAFSRMGGLTGLGGGLAIAADQVQRNVTINDPTNAGIVGGIGGAGSGLASGALLGSQIAGPVGAMIGGVTGALIGAINGAVNAFQTKKLENNLKALDKASTDLETAFKKLESNTTEANRAEAQTKLNAKVGAIANVAGQANFGAGGTARTITETLRGIDPTGLVGTLTGQQQEGEARDAMLSGLTQLTLDSDRLGANQLNKVSTKSITDFLDRTKGMEAPDKQLAMARANQGYQVMAAGGMKENDIFLSKYIAQQKQQGKTSEQISKELSDPKARERAIQSGKELLANEGELALKQAVLSRTAKDLAVATEQLVDVYRRAGASLDRYSAELEQF